MQERWLLRQPSADADALLLCFPFAGAGTSAFRKWPRQIGPFEVCPVQLPGRESRIAESAPHTLQELGRAAADALAPRLDRPFAVFGHCLGALIGFSMLESLLDRGGPMPGRFFASSARSPGDGFFGPVKPWISDQDLMAHVRDVILGTGEAVASRELVAMVAAILRRDLTMFAAHQPSAPFRLPCPITTVAWSKDDVRPAEMSGWRRYGDMTQFEVPGGHFDILNPPAVFYTELLREWSAAPIDAGAAKTWDVPPAHAAELQSVETALRGCPGIRDAAVIVTGTGPSRRLVGFVVGDGGLLAHEVRRALRGHVPDRMVPAELIQVRHIARTKNGTPDHQALRSGADFAALDGSTYLSPRNWAEELVVAVWQDNLPADRIGTADDFFALGGSSLAAARICRALEARLQIKLGLEALLRHNTPQQLARALMLRCERPTTSPAA